MPRFGATSKRSLNSCHPLLQQLFREVVKTVDCTVLEGHRDKARQNRLYTMEPPRTKVQWPDSRHNTTPAEAIDAAPFWPALPHVRWPDTCLAAEYPRVLGQWYFFIGYVIRTAQDMGIKIRTGADWNKNHLMTDNTFDDLAHFELVRPIPDINIYAKTAHLRRQYLAASAHQRLWREAQNEVTP